MSDIKNDTDLKPSDHILDDFLTKHGMMIEFREAQVFLRSLREAFRREENDNDDDWSPRAITPAEAEAFGVAVQEFASKHNIELEES